MKSNEEYLKELFNKYDEIKETKGKSDFYKNRISKQLPNKLLKTVAVSFLCLVSTVGIVYAGIQTYNKIWKEPDTYKFSEERKITEEDISKSLTEEEAVAKAKKITEDLGKTFGNVTRAELIKNVSANRMDWYIGTDNQISITIQSETGKLKQISDWSIDDTKIPSTVSKEEARNIAKEIYLKLGYNDGEYEIASLSQNAIADGTNLWQVNFCKKYDGIYNYYQDIRISFIPEVKQLTILTIFDYPYEDNPIVIAKEDATRIAKEKAIELGNDENKIKNVTTTLSIEKMNAHVYSQGQFKEQPKEENTKTVNIEDTIVYRTEDIVRKVWVVEIEYYSDFAAIDKYYVDTTTGEIIGGDSTK